MVYSFNNWHDGSSGTKCSDKLDALPSTDLTRGDDNEASVEEIEKEKEEVSTAFDSILFSSIFNVLHPKAYSHTVPLFQLLISSLVEQFFSKTGFSKTLQQAVISDALEPLGCLFWSKKQVPPFK